MSEFGKVVTGRLQAMGNNLAQWPRTWEYGLLGCVCYGEGRALFKRDFALGHTSFFTHFLSFLLAS